MRQTQFREVIILSAELSTKDTTINDMNTKLLGNSLTTLQINSSLACGVYKGITEASFVTLPKNKDDIQKIKELAFNTYDQESILYQDKSGDAYLIYQDGSKESIGQLRKVNNNKGLENYTILNGEIYATI